MIVILIAALIIHLQLAQGTRITREVRDTMTGIAGIATTGICMMESAKIATNTAGKTHGLAPMTTSRLQQIESIHTVARATQMTVLGVDEARAGEMHTTHIAREGQVEMTVAVRQTLAIQGADHGRDMTIIAMKPRPIMSTMNVHDNERIRAIIRFLGLRPLLMTTVSRQ